MQILKEMIVYLMRMLTCSSWNKPVIFVVLTILLIFKRFNKDGYIHHLWTLFLIKFARILSLRSIHFAPTHCSWVTKISSKNGNWKERWEGTREDWETISVVPSLHAIILSGSLKMLFGSPLPAIDITAHDSLLTFDWH